MTNVFAVVTHKGSESTSNNYVVGYEPHGIIESDHVINKQDLIGCYEGMDAGGQTGYNEHDLAPEKRSLTLQLSY